MGTVLLTSTTMTIVIYGYCPANFGHYDDRNLWVLSFHWFVISPLRWWFMATVLRPLWRLWFMGTVLLVLLHHHDDPDLWLLSFYCFCYTVMTILIYGYCPTDFVTSPWRLWFKGTVLVLILLHSDDDRDLRVLTFYWFSYTLMMIVIYGYYPSADFVTLSWWSSFTVLTMIVIYGLYTCTDCDTPSWWSWFTGTILLLILLHFHDDLDLRVLSFYWFCYTLMIVVNYGYYQSTDFDTLSW